MTTNAECTTAASFITAAVTQATFAAFGGPPSQGTNPKLQVTDGNRNNTLPASLTAAAAALTAIGQGGSQSANTSATYAGWAASVLLSVSMAAAVGDSVSAERLRTAAQVLTNLSNGV